MSPSALVPVGCVKLASLIVLLGACLPSAAPAAPPPSAYGVWDRGASYDPKDYPFLRGSASGGKWSDVEPQPGKFDWRAVDQAVDRAVASQTFVYLSLDVGPNAPEWIYQQGVPKVFTDDSRHEGKWQYYPHYLSPAYRSLFERLVTEFAKHIRTWPLAKQSRVAFIQVKTGCTGDECAYKGEPKDRRLALPEESPAWRSFRLETFALFAKLFLDGPGPRIDLLFNAVGPDAEEGTGDAAVWQWLTSRLHSSFGIKGGALSRGHHLAGERSVCQQWNPYLIDPKGLALFSRSEMDNTWTRPWYRLNLPLNFYWGAVNALNAGQSVWDVQERAIEESKAGGFEHAFHFFNRYAGQLRPETADHAFCALHKGLDAADTKAYPEARFGAAKKGNTDRVLKICAAYAKYGASADDPEALKGGQVAQRREQKGFNDVGWDIWPDNYSRFLGQLDADATSIPLWRIGGPLTKDSSIYARFARGFEHATGKDALYFKLADGFSRDTQPKQMTFQVVWYDGQAGSTWKLVYDAGAEAMKTGLTTTGTGDKRWHHATVTVNDAVLQHGGAKGSDLALLNTDAKDDVFSLLEVHRGVPEALPASSQATAATTQPAAAPPAIGRRRTMQK